MSDFLSIKSDSIKQLESDLKTFAAKAFPYATKSAINSSAFRARVFAQRNIRETMINRNKFSESSVRVRQTKTLNVSQQHAIVGSIADYLKTQEFGGIKRKAGKHGVAIPTAYAAGEAEGKTVRTRLVRKANKLNNLKMTRRRKSSSRKQQNLIAIKEASTSGRKVVFLDLGKRKGLFKVVGGKRRPRIKMLHDLSNTSVTIPKNPWLQPAVESTQRVMPELYRNSLIFQLKRRGLFKG